MDSGQVTIGTFIADSTCACVGPTPQESLLEVFALEKYLQYLPNVQSFNTFVLYNTGMIISIVHINWSRLVGIKLYTSARRLPVRPPVFPKSVEKSKLIRPSVRHKNFNLGHNF